MADKLATLTRAVRQASRLKELDAGVNLRCSSGALPGDHFLISQLFLQKELIDE